MTWVAIAAGAAAVIGAGASYAGSKKQSDAAKRGSNQQMSMFDTLNQQQQPFIQSGYGAMGKLNTLLGIGGVPRGTSAPPGPAMPPNPGYRPTPGGGVQPIAQMGPQSAPPMDNQMMANPRLRQLLTLRAAHGDTEAARMLGQA